MGRAPSFTQLVEIIEEDLQNLIQESNDISGQIASMANTQNQAINERARALGVDYNDLQRTLLVQFLDAQFALLVKFTICSASEAEEAKRALKLKYKLTG